MGICSRLRPVQASEERSEVRAKTVQCIFIVTMTHHAAMTVCRATVFRCYVCSHLGQTWFTNSQKSVLSYKRRMWCCIDG